ncbi:hypothetical protein PHLCEN_2v7654 [Hermanssonia centrifuga]|uniref:Cytochrome P450 n=1 Tax=Hermanssonia centrifuga TaxID=98765 RepID=A0A2R6NVX6_9APHY|nr:hypothetical protein PHLCEN_2v7654 [Hermanssonia centrifuga]
MTLYPDVLARAQKEIDEVVGRERMPNFDDEGSLPYINALIKEVLRWRPVLPLSTTHLAFFELELIHFMRRFAEEMRAGTTVLENVWAMAHDPEYFPDPDEFRPERYLDGDGKLSDSKTDTNAQKYFAFGFGRRLCAGKHLADQTVFIDIASFIWAFSVQKATDEKGLPITPSRDAIINDGVVV